MHSFHSGHCNMYAVSGSWLSHSIVNLYKLNYWIQFNSSYLNSDTSQHWATEKISNQINHSCHGPVYSATSSRGTSCGCNVSMICTRASPRALSHASISARCPWCPHAEPTRSSLVPTRLGTTVSSLDWWRSCTGTPHSTLQTAPLVPALDWLGYGWAWTARCCLSQVCLRGTGITVLLGYSAAW